MAVDVLVSNLLAVEVQCLLYVERGILSACFNDTLQHVWESSLVHIEKLLLQGCEVVVAAATTKRKRHTLTPDDRCVDDADSEDTWSLSPQPEGAAPRADTTVSLCRIVAAIRSARQSGNSRMCPSHRLKSQ